MLFLSNTFFYCRLVNISLRYVNKIEYIKITVHIYNNFEIKLRNLRYPKIFTYHWIIIAINWRCFIIIYCFVCNFTGGNYMLVSIHEDKIYYFQFRKAERETFTSLSFKLQLSCHIAIIFIDTGSIYTRYTVYFIYSEFFPSTIFTRNQ